MHYQFVRAPVCFASGAGRGDARAAGLGFEVSVGAVRFPFKFTRRRGERQEGSIALSGPAGQKMLPPAIYPYYGKGQEYRSYSL